MLYNAQGRLDELEAIAARLQEDLLASLSGSAGTSGKDGKEGEEGAAPGGKVRQSPWVRPCIASVVKLCHAERFGWHRPAPGEDGGLLGFLGAGAYCMVTP